MLDLCRFPKTVGYCYAVNFVNDVHFSLDCLDRNFYFMQAHVRELEEEVKLLKNLSHPNIVVSTLSYLVTVDLGASFVYIF